MINEAMYDVAVVGGGPAGTASAYYAAKLGLKTVVFEKSTYPRPKPCGGALSARSIPLLGKHAVNSINCQVDELRLFAPSFKSFTARNLPGHFVRREEFDAAMAEDAKEAGAVLVDNCRVKIIKPLSSDGNGYEITTTAGEDKIIARYVVKATGFQKKGVVDSPVIPETFERDYLAMTVVSETPIDNKALEGVGFSDKILGIFFGAVPNGYGWYFVKNGYVNIGIGATAILLEDTGAANAYKNFVATLKEKNLLPADLALAKERVFPLPFKRTAKRTVFGNILLVGDSAGFVSPVTGEGLYYSIKGGQLAAEAIHRHVKNGTPLISYQENWQKAFGKNLNKYGYALREAVYKSRQRMELAVALGRHDTRMAAILEKMVYGTISYRQTLRKALLRAPVSLLKAAFKG